MSCGNRWCFCTGACRKSRRDPLQKEEFDWAYPPLGPTPKKEPDQPKPRVSGIEDDPGPSQDFIRGFCMSPRHAPPMHIYIPPGKRYRHVCPSCGEEVIIRSILAHYW